MSYDGIGHIVFGSIIALQVAAIFILMRRKNPARPSRNHLQTSDEKYRDLFENANDAIFILDSEHNYIDVNRRATELFGYSREEFLRLNVMDVIPPAQIPTSDEEFKKLSQHGKYEKFVGKMKTKDGRWMDIEVNSSVIVNDGRILGSRDIVRDITDRKKAEEEKEALISSLQKALDEIKTLKGILPLCSFCKRIRDKKGVWKEVDVFIHSHSSADVSHSVCPECMMKHYSEYLTEE